MLTLDFNQVGHHVGVDLVGIQVISLVAVHLQIDQAWQEPGGIIVLLSLDRADRPVADGDPYRLASG
ncbi:hypothetical protein GCM10022225_78100 [Plantactinospora mayteni]|uniref:Uncharacterized protein n=1 Tax=Plantactinospora mayteni TaxID=566021 RepID=A0ABQ4ERF7_9ACTN|nr:hypothetical protein Pma05_38250 [Plantactinospora mayteni]